MYGTISRFADLCYFALTYTADWPFIGTTPHDPKHKANWFSTRSTTYYSALFLFCCEWPQWNMESGIATGNRDPYLKTAGICNSWNCIFCPTISAKRESMVDGFIYACLFSIQPVIVYRLPRRHHPFDLFPSPFGTTLVWRFQ